jgi:hypothetical protein
MKFSNQTGVKIVVAYGGAPISRQVCGFSRFCCFKIVHVLSFFVVFILFWFFISW